MVNIKCILTVPGVNYTPAPASWMLSSFERVAKCHSKVEVPLRYATGTNIHMYAGACSGRVVAGALHSNELSDDANSTL